MVELVALQQLPTQYTWENSIDIGSVEHTCASKEVAESFFTSIFFAVAS
jgi:hypothetical protein